MQPSKELVFSYFAGQATSAQQKAIGDWLARPENRELYFQWLDEWERTFPQYSPDVLHHLERFQQRVNTRHEETAPRIRPVISRERSFGYIGRWQAAAAVVVGVCIAGWLLRGPIFYKTITTGQQQLRTLTLPDGSMVALNSKSSLRMPRIGYGWLSRNVTLNGDAVFDVKHLDNDQPFVVQTADGLAVEVLGTEFSVRSRATGAEVVLKRGKVNLHYATSNHPDQNLMMKPGDRVTLDNRGALRLQERPDTNRFAQWRYRLFSFNNTSLHDVALQIQNVFGVTVQLADPALAQRTLTGTIRAGSSDELAEALAELLNLRVGHREQHLVFSTASEPQITQ